VRTSDLNLHLKSIFSYRRQTLQFHCADHWGQIYRKFAVWSENKQIPQINAVVKIRIISR